MQQIGPYQVVGELGRGAMGAVYRVLDPQVPDRQLAVKVIALGAALSPDALERFLREAEVLARVRHVGVVRVHGFERAPQGAYLVQELVEGPTLRELLRQQGPPGPDAAVRIVRDLADAVSAVHAEGILHRDLKPDNVVMRDGRPVLLDFGVARDLDAETLTKTGLLIGTPAYMAPEQAAGERVGPGADVYALGGLLYELLVGAPPFKGDSYSVLKQVFENTPAWPSELGVDVPPELEALLRRAMAKAPQDRFPSAAALRDALDRSLTVPSPAATSGRSRVALLAGLLLGALLLVAFLLVRPAEPAATPPRVAEVPGDPADSTPTAERPQLWALAVGDRFSAEILYDLRVEGAQTRLDVRLDVTVERIAGAVAELTFDPVQMHARAAPLNMVDAEQPASSHGPLSRVLDQVKAPFTCTIDMRSGAVTMRGLDPIQDGIRARRDAFLPMATAMAGGETDATIQATADYLAEALRQTFAPDYLGQSLNAVSHVANYGWQEKAPGRFQLEGRGEPLLRFVGVDPIKQLHVTRTGETRYSDGRLVLGEVTQTLSSGATLRWSWTLVD